MLGEPFQQSCFALLSKPCQIEATLKLARPQFGGLAGPDPTLRPALPLTAVLSCVQAAALGSDIENPYLRITRIIVWVAIGLAAVTLVHIVLLLLFVTRRWTLPDMLYFPRPQLFVMALAVPATAEGAASESQAASSGTSAVPVPVRVLLSGMLLQVSVDQ